MNKLNDDILNAINGLLPSDSMERQIRLRDTGSVQARYVERDHDDPNPDSFTLSDRGYNKLVDPDVHHGMDVDQLICLIEDIADESFREKAVAAIARKDTDDLLLERIKQLHPRQIESLKREWDTDINTFNGEVDECDIFAVVARLAGKQRFETYLKAHAYRKCSDYVLGSRSSYYLLGNDEITGLADDFFNELLKLAAQHYLIFEEIPVTINRNGDWEVVHPADYDPWKQYYFLTVSDDYLNSDVATVYRVADLEDNYFDDKVVLHWRHEINKEKFGFHSEFPDLESAAKCCREVVTKVELTGMDRHIAAMQMQFKVAEWLVDDRNRSERGEFRQVRQARFEMVNGEWSLISDEKEFGHVRDDDDIFADELNE